MRLPLTARNKCLGPEQIEYALVCPVPKFTPNANLDPGIDPGALSVIFPNSPEYLSLLQKIERLNSSSLV